MTQQQDTVVTLPAEPCLALVVDIVRGPDDREIVHLDVVGPPEQLVDELRHARLLPEAS